jgi:2-oxoglutarate dehydrogenase E1 component
LHNTAILRFERLYPLPFRLAEVLDRYPNAEIRWVQEEPANQGAWSFVAMNAPPMVNRPIEGVTRPSSSSPAVGTHQRHVAEQQAVVEQAFA